MSDFNDYNYSQWASAREERDDAAILLASAYVNRDMAAADRYAAQFAAAEDKMDALDRELGK